MLEEILMILRHLFAFNENPGPCIYGRLLSATYI